MDFECHVTAELPRDPIVLKLMEDAAAMGWWKTSTIHNDPVMGTGARFYFTKHSSDFVHLHKEMLELCRELQPHPEVKVLRRKIEATILDDWMR